MGEGMKHGLTKAVLGMYLVSTFVFCVTLAKDDPSGRSIWARMRPDAGSLGMYCISSAYPNFTLPDEVQAAADDGQRAQQTAPDTLTLTGTDESEAQVSEIITTEETAPEPVVFGEEPAVLIVHTHATESYLPSSGGNYHKKGKQNTVRDIGSVLAETLEGEEDEDIVLLENGEVDVGDLAYTAFLLAMDTKHLCSEDCKGLCPGCGVNLNREPCRCKKQVDPRWAALEQLLDKN